MRNAPISAKRVKISGWKTGNRRKPGKKPPGNRKTRKAELNKMSAGSLAVFPGCWGRVGGRAGGADEVTSLLSWLCFLAVPQGWRIPHSAFHAGSSEMYSKTAWKMLLLCLEKAANYNNNFKNPLMG